MKARSDDTAPEAYRAGSGGPLPVGGFVLLVPGAEAPLLALSLPPGLRGLTREKAAQRMVSDATGLPVATVELRPFRPGRDRDGWTSVVLAAPERLAAWRALPEAAQPGCRAILPDYLALPAADGLWTISAQGDDVAARLGPGDGFTAEPELAALLIEKARDAAAPRAVLRLGALPARVEAAIGALGVPVFDRVDAAAAQDLGRPAALAHGEREVDLARDPDAAAARLRRQVLPWLAPALLAVVALAAWSVGSLLEIRALNDRAAGYRRETTDLVRARVLPTGPILDIRAQVSQALDRRRAASRQTDAAALAPLALFAAAADVLFAARATVQKVAFQRGGGLNVEVVMPGFADLDRLVAALEKAGLSVLVAQSNAETDGSGVRGLLVVQARGAKP